ncbi:hypothetical protein RHMOL_Rhmol04G0221900 [Rhododendron molle]|uniref:Uncharacterized protein n=1 Tax=Rhododendron molle TaxID=49168 RepID=A0ACC0P4C0_RHOML|nr:hypothetical protein RHMOL_Rhmol04G0221900 [Rhododendron molle]
MDKTHDLDLLTVARWAATFLEVQIKKRGRIWGEEDAMVSGGNGVVHSSGTAVVGGGAGAGADPSGEGTTEGVTAVAGDGGSSIEVAAAGDSGRVEAIEAGGGSEAAADIRGVDAASGSGGGSMGGRDGDAGSGGGVTSSSGATGTPYTPTMEELLATAERASDGQQADDSPVVVVGGRVAATSVLRSMVVGPRGGDSGIRASRPVPFEAGDFSDSAEPQDVMGAFRLEPGVEAVLRGARTLEDRTSALLLGALLSGAGASDTGGLGVESETEEREAEEQEPEVVAEQRVTAVDEVKAYLKGERPGFTRTTDVYGHGGSAGSLRYFKALPTRVRALVEAAGFGPFIQLLTMVRIDRAVLTALTERWWDTTNTFHFWFGEMSNTPLDFAAITGLRVRGDPIPYDLSIVLDDAALRWFLGQVPRHSGGVAEYGQFIEYWDHEHVSDEEAAQMARAYLLYMFGASLFPNRRS